MSIDRVVTKRPPLLSPSSYKRRVDASFQGRLLRDALDPRVYVSRVKRSDAQNTFIRVCIGSYMIHATSAPPAPFHQCT